DFQHGLPPAFPNVVRELGQPQTVFATGQDVTGEFAQAFAPPFAYAVKLVSVWNQKLPDKPVDLFDQRLSDETLDRLSRVIDEMQDDGEHTSIGRELADKALKALAESFADLLKIEEMKLQLVHRLDGRVGDSQFLRGQLDELINEFLVVSVNLA